MPDNLIENIINSSLEKNAINFKNSFEELMNERISIELRDRKMKIANNIVDEGALKTEARSAKNFGRAADEIGRLRKEHDEAMALIKAIVRDINVLSTRPARIIKFEDLVDQINEWGDAARKIIRNSVKK